MGFLFSKKKGKSKKTGGARSKKENDGQGTQDEKQRHFLELPCDL
jgi:hypothetical protein